QAQLARHFVSRLEVGAHRRFFDVGAPRRAGGVDVDRHQGFGMVDDHRAARRQLDSARIRGFDLVFELETGEQRDVVAIRFDALDVVRHDYAHEGGGLVVDVVGIDEDFADFGRVVIAYGADDQAGFQVDENGRLVFARRAVDGIPELEQIGQVPLE